MTVEVETTGSVGDTTGESTNAGTIATDKTIETAGDGGETPQASAYNPNFKYKVHGQEKEMDEWLRSAIKDAETEKKARDLYTRADGIDHVKQDRERLVEENNAIRSEQQNFQRTIEELDFYVKNDDLTSFFEKTAIPREQVLRWALREVEMADNPQARQQYEQHRMQQIHNYQQQMQGSQVMSTYEQASVDLRTRELDFSLRQPETQALMESFDSRAGRPGAFRDEIISRGQFHYYTRGVDVPVDQLVNEVVQLFGVSQTQPTQSVTTGPSNGAIQGAKNKPVLPSIPSSGQSAVKKNPGKGLAGLKKVAAEKLAQLG